MSKVQIRLPVPSVLYGESGHFYRGSPFEHATTAEPSPEAMRTEQCPTRSEVQIVKARICELHAQVVVKTAP